MRKERIKIMLDFAVIFDLDGVIVDSNWAHQKAIQTFCLGYGLDISEEKLKTDIFGRRNIDWIADVFNEILLSMDFNRLSKEKDTIFRKIFVPYLNLLPGLPAFLDMLKSHGIPMAVASSASASNVNFILKNTHIINNFTVILDETSTTNGKPEPEIYLNAANKLKVSPARCIVFEDSLPGISAARRAGCKVVGVTTSHECGELADIDMVIADFIDITVVDLAMLLS